MIYVVERKTRDGEWQVINQVPQEYRTTYLEKSDADYVLGYMQCLWPKEQYRVSKYKRVK